MRTHISALHWEWVQILTGYAKRPTCFQASSRPNAQHQGRGCATSPECCCSEPPLSIRSRLALLSMRRFQRSEPAGFCSSFQTSQPAKITVTAITDLKINNCCRLSTLWSHKAEAIHVHPTIIGNGSHLTLNIWYMRMSNIPFIGGSLCSNISLVSRTLLISSR